MPYDPPPSTHFIITYLFSYLARTQWAEEQLGALQSALATKLEERAKEAGDRLDVLKSRVDTLEEVGGSLCSGMPLPLSLFFDRLIGSCLSPWSLMDSFIDRCLPP